MRRPASGGDFGPARAGARWSRRERQRSIRRLPFAPRASVAWVRVSFHVQPAALPRSPLGTRYDVPTNFFGELTGVLPFAFAILAAVAWGRLALERRRLRG